MNIITNEKTFPSFSEKVWPRANIFREAIIILLGSWLIALTAQIVIPLAPVPATGQTFGVLLISALLGRKRGVWTVIIYLVQGIAGFPFFAGATGGIAKLIGPTGGYLFGFIFAAYVVGWLSEKGWDRRFIPTIFSMGIGNLIIYACGLTWLSYFMGWNASLSAGLFPFIFGDILKIFLAAIILPTLWSWQDKFHPNYNAKR